MHRHRALISLLLAAAVLAGQWFAATHAPEHALQPGAAHDCVVCVYAHGAGAGALPQAAALILAGALEAPRPGPPQGLRTAAPRHHPIRGPPDLLV